MEKEKGKKSEEVEENLTGRRKLLMTVKVSDLLVSLNVPLNSYHVILSDFDGTCTYRNDMLISMSNEVEKSKIFLYETRNKLEQKTT